MGGELGVGGVTESKEDAHRRRKGVSCFFLLRELRRYVLKSSWIHFFKKRKHESIIQKGVSIRLGNSEGAGDFGNRNFPLNIYSIWCPAQIDE